MKRYIYRTLSFMLAVSFLTSCLKDDSLVLDPEKGHNVIEFANPATIVTNGSVYPLYNFAFDLAPQATLPITISYSGPESGAPEDIVVNFDAGTAAEVDAYNKNQDKEFDMIDADVFSLSTKTVTIKKGEKKATFNVLLAPNKFDFQKSYVLPLKITSSSSGVISGNFSTILLAVGGKNMYDGVYTVTGTFNDTQFSTYTGHPSFEVHLITQGLTEAAMFDPNFNGGTFILPFKNGTANSGYGSFTPVFRIDANNNVVSVVNYYGQPAPANGRAAKLDPTGINKYNPETKTLEVSYIMTQNGDRTFLNHKMVYKGPRP
jgi:hypothetical protein